MINLKEISIENGVSYIKDDTNFIYKTTDENRGANSKMWITNAMGPNFSFETHYSYLFKTSFRRNANRDVSARNFGEIFSNNIATALNLPHVVYFYCCFENINNNKCFGTVCPTYKESIDDVEITGHDLHMQYLMKTGKEEPYNCVYSYAKQLQVVYGDRLSVQQIEDIKQSMLKMALFDYITCQTDRHWKNTGFLVRNGNDFSKFELIPLYDNEKCFVFNKSLNWLEKMSVDMQKSEDNVEKIILPLVNSFDRVPRFGIKTSTCCEGEFENLMPKRSDVGQETYTQIFTKELAEELKNNEELRDFYFKVKNLDIRETLKDEDTPEFLQDFASCIWDARINQLDKTYENMFGKMEEPCEEANINEQ